MEVQINGKWIGKTNLKDLDRNYSAFGILFGVRTSNILPIGHNGKPDEISKEMKIELETKNYIYKAVPEIEKFYFDEGWLELFEQAKEYEKEYGASNIRFTAYFE